MDRLAFLANRHDVDLRVRPMVTHACLTHRVGAPSYVTVSAGLDAPRRLPAAACLLHVVALGWAGRQFRFRYPLPEDGPELAARVARERRDYRYPYRLGLRTLMPDSWLKEKEREEADPRAAAEEAGVTVADLAARVRDWRTGSRPGSTDIAEYLARGDLKPARAIPAPIPWEAPPAPPPPAPTLPPRRGKSERAALLRAIQAEWEERERFEGRIPF